MKKIGWICILTIMLLSGCKDKNETSLRYTGVVEATQYDVVTDVGGIIQDVLVKEGDNVEPGTVVARLEDESLNYSVQQQEAGYRAKEEQLKEIKNGPRDEEIAMVEEELQGAEINLRIAKEQYAHQQDIYDNTKKLLDEGGISEQQLKDVKLGMDQLEASVGQKEKAVASIRAKLELLKKGPTQETIKSNGYHLEQLKYAYEQAKTQKEKTNVRAFSEGTVLYQYYQKGEFLSPGAPIVTLVDTKDLWMKIYIPEKEMHTLKVGQQVALLSDMLKEQNLAGKVVFISPQAEFTPSNVTTKEDRHNRVHEVKIDITEGFEYLNPGMVLDADLYRKNMD